MKVAVIGSRELIVNDLEKYLPSDTKKIVSGRTNRIDTCTKIFQI